MNSRPEVLLSHLGWSGFRIACAGVTALYIDPPAGCDLPLDREITLLLTHGHPEHVAGTLAHLRQPARKACVQVIASAALCRYLRRRSGNPDDRFQACDAEQHFTLAGLAFDVFRWQHMPLLPPGIQPALHHIKHLLGHPALALHIIVAGLRGPLPWPMLGFRIVFPHGSAILVYGEGLHRRTGKDRVGAIRTRLPAELLLVAVEPEDIDVLPELIDATGATTIGLYQAHEKWRQAFALPCADLDTLAATLATQGKHALVFTPETTHRLAL